MEESEKRKERLRAMRAEAAQAHSSSSFATPATPSYLSNPLAETPSQEEPRPAPRFDFYTDPMAAFSTNKRGNNVSDPRYAGHFAPPVNSGSAVVRFPPPPPGMRNAETTLAHQFQGNYSSDQRMHQGQGFGHKPISQMRPVGMSRPTNMHQGNLESIASGGAASYIYNSPSPGPRESRSPSPGFCPTGTGSPFNASQDRGQWLNNSPSPGSGYRGSPSPSWGRGGGRWHRGGASLGSGRRGGRGLGSGGHSFTVDRPSGPERFYNESMVEDPWKFLEPIIWRKVEAPPCTPDSSKPWSPRSLGTKKAKVSDASNNSSTQPSLAEYLAASFNEAVGDAPSA